MTPANVLLEILGAHAAAAGRCPTTPELNQALCERGFRMKQFGGAAALLGELAKGGKIRVMIHAKNWRTVEILEGPQAGKSTLPPPRPWAVYKVADRAGYHRVDA